MQIPVNKNLDQYQGDFFKGLTLRQTIYVVLTLAVGIASYLVFNVALGIPQTLSLYLVLPVSGAVAFAGFYKFDGRLELRAYIKKRMGISRMPLYRHRPFMLMALAEEGAITPEEPATRRGKRCTPGTVALITGPEAEDEAEERRRGPYGQDAGL